MKTVQISVELATQISGGERGVKGKTIPSPASWAVTVMPLAHLLIVTTGRRQRDRGRVWEGEAGKGGG